jgi:AhpD family alkylhydroperoxidase
MTAPTQDHWRFNLIGRLTRRWTSKAARYRARVSDSNGCGYCLSAHTHISSTLARIRGEEIALNRAGHSSEPKREAAIDFAKRLIEMHGKVTDAESIAARDAGYIDPQIVEITPCRRSSCAVSVDQLHEQRQRHRHRLSAGQVA